jgi:hypothetical protein
VAEPNWVIEAPLAGDRVGADHGAAPPLPHAAAVLGSIGELVEVAEPY